MRFCRYPKKLFFFPLIVLAGTLIYLYYSCPVTSPSVSYSISASSTKTSVLGQPSVLLGGVEVPVELATTTQAVTKGLSGRASLGRERGLLFIFSRAARYRFWMPDMHFPIDIIWIDDGKVVSISENVSPKFDPVHPVFYTPPKPVRYVLEVNAGWSREHGVRPGDQITFKNI